MNLAKFDFKIDLLGILIAQLIAAYIEKDKDLLFVAFLLNTVADSLETVVAARALKK